MDQLASTAIFLGVLFFLLGSGVWVGLALMGVAYVGIEFLADRSAGSAMSGSPAVPAPAGGI